MTIFFILFIILLVPQWGYLILKNKEMNAAFFGWAIAVVFNLCIFFFAKVNAIGLMFLYISATFLSLKIVVANNHLKRNYRLNYMQWCLFCYTWFGMNPAPFKSFPAQPLTGYGSYYKKGITRILFGMLLIVLANIFFQYSSSSDYDLIVYLLWLIGLSFILHFGILNLSAGFLRSLGIGVTSLFKDPIKSTSLKEFWSKRWNIAFVELTTIAVLRPVKTKYGASIAFWASFIFSGLLHELAISLPVRTGFGKPFAYFIIQAVLIITIEENFIVKIKNVAIKRCWVIACLFLPIFLLFHPAFIEQVVLPLVRYFKIFM